MVTQFGSKEVREFRAAEWDGYRRLAKRLPDHHVLSVQLIRTQTNETAVVFTTVQRGEPVQSVLMGDARGRAYPSQKQPHVDDPNRPRLAEAMAAPVPMAMAAGVTAGDYGDMSPDTIALGQPPIKQPITPGLISLGTTLLSATFDLGEVVESGSGR